MDNALRNWKTTLLGIVLAIIGVVKASKSQTFVGAFTDQQVQVDLVTAVALVLAKDGDKAGTAPGTKGATDGAGPGSPS